LSLRNHTADEVLKVLTKRYGFFVERQNRGSHIQLKHADGRRITVPIHANRPLKLGVMKSIISQAGVTEEEFLRYL
jgi:predicted RNA binding protein YcfA (HicA-like mRNA interferase family)